MEITIIGAGNVGSHMALALHKAGIKIPQIYSRELANAQSVAQQTESTPIDDFSSLNTKSSIYLLAIKDDAIPGIARELSELLPETAILAHTSGATPSTVFASAVKNYGVFYPLQTFSKHKPVDFKRIPMCIDGNTAATKVQLRDLAELISPLVYDVDDEQRANLHLAAVFINNFTNAMLQASFEVTQKANLPREILAPLLQATIQKGAANEPKSVQTGPATRRDGQTIERHLEQLANHPDLLPVYKAITAYIQTF